MEPPPSFTPGAVVTLTGATSPSAVADSAGRISFTVALGPAHKAQQYSVKALVLETLGGYFTTKTVRFAV